MLNVLCARADAPPLSRASRLHSLKPSALQSEEPCYCCMARTQSDAPPLLCDHCQHAHKGISTACKERLLLTLHGENRKVTCLGSFASHACSKPYRLKQQKHNGACKPEKHCCLQVCALREQSTEGCTLHCGAITRQASAVGRVRAFTPNAPAFAQCETPIKTMWRRTSCCAEHVTPGCSYFCIRGDRVVW